MIKINILYLNNFFNLGGDNKCILMLSENFKSKKNKVIVATNGGELINELDNLEIEHIKIGDVSKKKPLNVIKIIRELKNIIKEKNIDIVHSHHRMCTLLVKFATRELNIRIIHTQHSCIADKLKLTKIALKKTNIISVSNGVMRILVEKSKIDKNSIKIIYNTIDTRKKRESSVDFKLLELKQNGYFIVGQISRADKLKGIYDFVDIAEKVLNKNDKIRFVFIGDGKEKNNMKKYISDKGLEDKVFLLGKKDNVIEHLKYLDLFLLCSYIEGLPLTPIEAFSQKVPVIASDIDGINEEIVNGENGLLVTKGDIDTFADKILYIYENEDINKKFTQISYELYLKNFNEINYYNEHEKIYRGV